MEYSTDTKPRRGRSQPPPGLQAAAATPPSPPTPAAPTPAPTESLRRARGLRLLGRDAGSGYADPRYLVRRRDGQVAHLSELLYVVLLHADGCPITELAERVSLRFGREVNADVVRILADT